VRLEVHTEVEIPGTIVCSIVVIIQNVGNTKLQTCLQIQLVVLSTTTELDTYVRTVEVTIA
jgi:hypothetical protein